MVMVVVVVVVDSAASAHHFQFETLQNNLLCPHLSMILALAAQLRLIFFIAKSIAKEQF